MPLRSQEPVASTGTVSAWWWSVPQKAVGRVAGLSTERDKVPSGFKGENHPACPVQPGSPDTDPDSATYWSRTSGKHSSHPEPLCEVRLLSGLHWDLGVVL